MTAHQEQNVEGVGIGVNLFEGASTLETLRAIRTEMTAIASLSGKGSGGGGSAIYGPSQSELSQREHNYKAEEKLESDHISSMARIRAQGKRAIGGDEVENLAQQKVRKAQLASQVEARARQIEQENARKAQEHQNFLIEQARIRRARITALSKTDSLTSPEGIQNTAQQRRLFQRHRNDEARDDLTNQFRRQIAEDTLAQREFLRRERALAKEREEFFRSPQAKLYSNFYAQGQNRVNAQRLGNGGFRDQLVSGSRPDDTFGTRQGQLRSRATRAGEEADARLAQEIAAEEAEEMRQLVAERQARKAAIEEQKRIGRVLADRYAKPPADPTHLNPSRNIAPVAKEVTEADLVKQYLATGGRDLGSGFEKWKQARSGVITPPTPPKPPGGGSGGRGGRGGNREGIFGQTGMVERFVAYQVLSQLVFGLKEYTVYSLEAAKATTEQGNALKYATEAAGGNLEANRQLATQLQAYGYNSAQAQQVVAQASRATYKHPEQTAALARVATDVAASRGGGLQDATRVIEDIQEGRDRTYREYFNTTPEDLYKKEAARVLATRTKITGIRTLDGNGTDGRDYKTEAQEISAYVSKLTEEEKEQIRLNFALSQAGRFQGDAAERATTLAGKMDLVGASFFNASANVGIFLSNLKPVKDILDLINVPGGILAPAQLRQGGTQNTITDANVIEYGADSSTSATATKQRALSNLLTGLANNITPLNTLKNYVTDPLQGLLTDGTNRGISDVEYDRIIAENRAKAQQVKQRNQLREQGQLGYRSLGAGGTAAGEYLTYEQLTSRGLGPGEILKNYIEDIRPKLDAASQAMKEFKDKRDALIKSLGGEDNDKVYKLDAKENARFLDQWMPDDYRAEALKREDARKEKEQHQKEKDNAARLAALGKLAEFKQGSFRVIDETASRIAGPENPYVKVLSDQITAAQRMHEQWGFLGKDVEEYELKLEELANNKALTRLEYGSYQKSSGLFNQIGRERDQRNGPGISRAEEDYLNVQSKIVDKAIQIPLLWKQAAESFGVHVDPVIVAMRQITGLATGLGFGAQTTSVGRSGSFRYGEQRDQFGNFTGGGTKLFGSLGQSGGGERYAGFNTGSKTATFGRTTYTLDDGRQDDYAKYAASQSQLLAQSPEVQRRTREAFADSAIEALKDLTPRQLNNSGLGNVYRGALNVKAQGLQTRIEEEQQKALLNAQEDERLNKQLRADEAFRASEIAKGRPADEVGREADKLLLSRTDNINPKDLTYSQFKDRSEALRREAERSVKEQDEAKEAVKQGQANQAAMLSAVEQIRNAIIGGNLGLAIEINNTTQAQVDENALQDSGTEVPGSYKASSLNGDIKLGGNSLRKYNRFGKRD